MRQLLEAGVHFGHQTRRWNPKMRPFIFAERNGIHIIDLAQTVKHLEESLEFVRETVARGEYVLFVGTKKQAQEPIAQEATRAGQPYVNKRWLGGMLTNFTTIKKRISLLEQLEARQQAGDFERMTKKEAAKLTDEMNKLTLTVGGMRKMKRVPGAVFIIDPHRERIAVTEANKLEVPVVATGDTNVDPDEIDHIIPANDDAIRARASRSVPRGPPPSPSRRSRSRPSPSTTSPPRTRSWLPSRAVAPCRSRPTSTRTRSSCRAPARSRSRLPCRRGRRPRPTRSPRSSPARPPRRRSRQSPADPRSGARAAPDT
jgi:small subunit ribosomal protein S2